MWLRTDGRICTMKQKSNKARPTNALGEIPYVILITDNDGFNVGQGVESDVFRLRTYRRDFRVVRDWPQASALRDVGCQTWAQASDKVNRGAEFVRPHGRHCLYLCIRILIFGFSFDERFHDGAYTEIENETT